MDGVVQAYNGNVQMIDSTSVRVHQHAAGAKKRRRSLHGSSFDKLRVRVEAD